MSGHAQLLDRVARLSDEHVIDAIHVVRRKPFHWPVVIGLMLVGAVAGLLVPVAPWFFAPSLAFIGMGLGMNLRTQWRVVARTSSRLLLLDASSVHARPTAIATGVSVGQLSVTPHRFWATVTIGGVPHTMTRTQLPRLQRMLDLGAH